MKKGFEEEKDKEEEDFGRGPINLGDEEEDVAAPLPEEDPFSLGADLDEEEDDPPFGFGPAIEE